MENKQNATATVCINELKRLAGLANAEAHPNSVYERFWMNTAIQLTNFADEISQTIYAEGTGLKT